ncbi:MAG: cytochrome c-type biogenesis protein CcmH [Candidatus Solibacter sp.]
MILIFVRLFFLTLLSVLAFAKPAEQPQLRVNRLEHSVLAPCCYAESVAIHQSEIALKMRMEIAKWVAAGLSDQKILGTYAGLYGSEVLVDPRTMPRGWTPFFPWLVLILGMLLVGWFLKRWREAPRPATAQSSAEVVNLPDFDEE